MKLALDFGVAYSTLSKWLRTARIDGQSNTQHQLSPEHKRIAQLEKDVTQSIKDRQFTVNQPNQVWVGDITYGVMTHTDRGAQSFERLFYQNVERSTVH